MAAIKKNGTVIRDMFANENSLGLMDDFFTRDFAIKGVDENW